MVLDDLPYESNAYGIHPHQRIRTRVPPRRRERREFLDLARVGVVVVLVVLAVAVVAIVVVLMSDCGCLFRGQAGVSLLTPKKLPCRSRSYTTTL